ncbi:MAG: hypothetical protein QOE70_6178 [Chthoniobacter sp.]|jgi:hypothetical protein|nr:hypothetical protein [Chthoniobacter sp.]
MKAGEHPTSNIRRPTSKGRGALVVALLLAMGMVSSADESREERAAVIIAVGAAGEEEYAGTFAKWAGNWQKASAAGEARTMTIGLGAEEKDCLPRLQQALQAEAKETAAALWLVLAGHGTFDGKEAKFNLRGDDLSASELAGWLQPFKRPVVIVCGFSASGAFLKPLSAPGRIVVSATKNGSESNFARFGGYFSEAIGDPSGDLDKDGQTSVLEAWLAAARRAADFYKNEGRLATEHSLLEDNGDGLGTPPDWFTGVRAVKKSSGNQTPDGLRAHQLHLVPSAAERALPPALRAERDALENELAQLRNAKASMPEDEYFARLEKILVQIAKLYRGAKKDQVPEAAAGVDR